MLLIRPAIPAPHVERLLGMGWAGWVWADGEGGWWWLLPSERADGAGAGDEGTAGWPEATEAACFFPAARWGGLAASPGRAAECRCPLTAKKDSRDDDV